MDEIIDTEWLGNVIFGSRLEGSFFAGGIILGGDNDHGNIGEARVIVQHLTQFETGQTGHHQIQSDQVGINGICHFDGFGAVVDRRRLVTFHADEHFHQIGDDDIIIYNQNLGHGFILRALAGTGKSMYAVRALQKRHVDQDIGAHERSLFPL